MVESNDPRVLDCARSSFGNFPAVRSREKPVHLRLLLDPLIDSGPPWPKTWHRGGADLFLVACAGNIAVADLKKKYVLGFFSPAMLNHTEFFRRTFVSLAYWTMYRHYFTPVHAACVLRQGRGLCLCGRGRSGKTSLAYYCARRGYAVLAEDLVCLTRDLKPRLRGNASHFHFAAEARELFPELVQWPLTPGHDGQECLVVSSANLGIKTFVGECSPGAVVFLRRGQKPGLQHVPAREAFELLLADIPLDGPRAMKAHRRAITRLVRCGAYRMGYRTLDEAWELLEQVPR